MTNTPYCAIIKYILINKEISLDISFIKNINKYLYNVFLSLDSCLKKHARPLTVADLHTHHQSLHPSLSRDDNEIYAEIFKAIEAVEVKEEVIGDLVNSIRQRENLSRLAIASFEATEDSKKIQEVLALSKEINEPTVSYKEIEFVTSDLEELYVQQVKGKGLRWRLSSLNSSLGSLRKGDFGFVFARPETGKTTLLASESTHMASQVEQPIIWFNNEEQGEKVMLRCFQAALGLPLEVILSDRKRAQKTYVNITKDNLKIYDEAILQRSEVEDVIASVEPSLIIFDQIDKISGFKADRNDLELGEIYQWARELAKKYAPVIGVCQADGTGEGIKWLTMAHVVNAKTAKQSEADWILGIGRSHDAGYEEVRHFNISKNKLLGDEDTLPERRHDKWDVYMRPRIARYEDIIL